MSSLPVLSADSAVRLRWRELPTLPQALGGQFAGVADNCLVVAGGSFFRTPPWQGGSKTWADLIYVLRPGASAWETAGHLPEPVAAGAAVTTSDGLVCLGGQGPNGHSPRSFRLRLRQGTPTFDELPDLPQPAALLAAAGNGQTIYATGGQSSPTATTALATFWALSLAAPKPAWEQLPPPPGPGRIYPLLIATKQGVYLASGAALTGTLGPPLGRRFLRDVWRYTRETGWVEQRALPHPVQAGSGIAWNDHILVFGGNDGSLADREFQIRDRHPGFHREVYRFKQEANRWSLLGQMPASLVTTGVVRWEKEFVIAGGEDRPAHRSARVFAGSLQN